MNAFAGATERGGDQIGLRRFSSLVPSVRLFLSTHIGMSLNLCAKCLIIFTILFISAPAAAAYCDPAKPPGQIDPATVRDYVKGAHGIANGVADGILNEALSKYPSFNAAVSFLDMFKFFMVADDAYCSFNQGNYQHAIVAATEYTAELAIAETIVGDVLSSPLAIANLVKLPIEWYLYRF